MNLSEYEYELRSGDKYCERTETVRKEENMQTQGMEGRDQRDQATVLVRGGVV